MLQFNRKYRINRGFFFELDVHMAGSLRGWILHVEDEHLEGQKGPQPIGLVPHWGGSLAQFCF